MCWFEYKYLSRDAYFSVAHNDATLRHNNLSKLGLAPQRTTEVDSAGFFYNISYSRQVIRIKNKRTMTKNLLFILFGCYLYIRVRFKCLLPFLNWFATLFKADLLNLFFSPRVRDMEWQIYWIKSRFFHIQNRSGQKYTIVKFSFSWNFYRPFQTVIWIFYRKKIRQNDSSKFKFRYFCPKTAILREIL